MMARIEQSIEINVPVHTAYNQLTRFEQYPHFVQYVEEVRQLDDTHLHLHSKAGNTDLEWDAEITQQVPDRCIAWRNTNGPKYEGRIELQPIREDGTRVTVTMECEPKQQVLAQHGNAETAIAQHAEHDLARFKKFIERLGHEMGDMHPLPSDAKNKSAKADKADKADAGRGEQVPGESVGKAIAQTASERRDAAGAASAKPRAEAAPRAREAPPEPARQAERKEALPQQMPWMAGLFQLWDGPFGMMRRMSEDMEQFLERVGGRTAAATIAAARPGIRTGARTDLRGMSNGAWMPSIEIAQRKNQFVVCAELAGVRREDVQVEVRADCLTIEGERRQEPPHEPQEIRSTERSYGHFYREVALPPGADPNAATAAMHDGMLEVTVPVAQGNARGRKLDIATQQ